MEKLRFILSSLWSFLAPFIRQLMSDSGILLAQAAMSAVSAVASTMNDASGEAKRNQAFNLILSDLTKLGIEMAASTINAAIEAAVVKLKAGN